MSNLCFLISVVENISLLKEWTGVIQRDKCSTWYSRLTERTEARSCFSDAWYEKGNYRDGEKGECGRCCRRMKVQRGERSGGFNSINRDRTIRLTATSAPRHIPFNYLSTCRSLYSHTICLPKVCVRLIIGQSCGVDESLTPARGSLSPPDHSATLSMSSSNKQLALRLTTD